MTRSRLVVVSSLAIVGAGALVTLGASLLDPARAAVGPVPAAALALPGDSSFVMGVDVRRLVQSRAYQRALENPAAQPQPFRELEEKTGLRPDRDVELLVIAGHGGSPGEGVAFVKGAFDRQALVRSLESRKRTTWKKEPGGTVYLFQEGQKGAPALAFLDDQSLVIGSEAGVQATLANHADGGKGLRGNPTLIELLSSVKTDSTFWMVGDQSLLGQMHKLWPGAGPAGGPADGAPLGLPALKTLMVAGDLDPALTLEATGTAADEAGARSLADLVRGFTALMTLQAGQKPELKELASAISISTEANRVRLAARFPYELLDKLGTPRPAPAPKR